MTRRWAKNVNSDLMKPFENFLDDFENKLSPELWDELEFLCSDLDKEARELEEKFKELEEELVEAREEIEKLEEQLENEK